MRSDRETAGVALRYELKRSEREEMSVSVPFASLQRLRMPDAEARARFVTAVLDARCRDGEALELLGEDVAQLAAPARSRLQGRIGVLTPAVGLISNLNAWENISLPAAYHGTPPAAEVANTAREALAALGSDVPRLLARLPHELGIFEQKLVAFVRLLTTLPELVVFDALEAGLDRAERVRAAQFVDEYRTRRPAGTLLIVDPPGGLS
jgi:predicted ABC-type transport system involved in lysophospholipase L1 biosynthesis ATPase subunit